MVNLGSADWLDKRVMTAAHTRTTFQCECPQGIYYSIYLKVITSYYANILLIAMLLYFDRIIQGLKLTKQKYVNI